MHLSSQQSQSNNLLWQDQVHLLMILISKFQKSIKPLKVKDYSIFNIFFGSGKYSWNIWLFGSRVVCKITSLCRNLEISVSIISNSILKTFKGGTNGHTRISSHSMVTPKFSYIPEKLVLGNVLSFFKNICYVAYLKILRFVY